MCLANEMKSVFSLIVAVTILCSCQRTLYLDGSWNPGTYKLKTEVKFHGLARSYLLHIPSNPPDNRWPLVVVLHGAFSTAHEMERQSGFSQLADREGFCVAYPNGIGIFGLLQHWNAGHCCGKAAKDGVDDVAFLDAVIRDITRILPVDEERIYFVGHSNGGMMVYRYTAEPSNAVAGAAVVGGAINSKVEGPYETWSPSPPKHPVPMLILHGTNDQIIPLHGGMSPIKSNGLIYAPLSEAEAFWVMYNESAATVRVELLEGWGHDWPGRYFTEQAGIPGPMHGYDAAQVIWEFFKMHHERP